MGDPLRAPPATILAASSPGELRIAVWDGTLRDYAVWRPGRPDGVGDVHRGRVTARTRALAGSFVALEDETGFLPDSEQDGAAAAGSLIAVRVTRAAQGGKGPRLSARVDAPEAEAGPVRRVRRGPGALELLAARYPASGIVLDDPALAARLHPSLGGRLRQVRQAFDAAIADEVAALADSTQALPGGGMLRIQPTAALVAIDVDAGGALDGMTRKAASHLVFNERVVPALARAIRLRNLAGAILVDFAGLSARRRADLAIPLRAALAEDPISCSLVGFTGLGLAEIVRRRIHPPLHEVLAGPHAAAAAALREAVAQHRPGGGLILRMAPDIAASCEQDATMRAELAQSAAHDLMLQSDPALLAGTWRIDNTRSDAQRLQARHYGAGSAGVPV